jgi:integrase
MWIEKYTGGYRIRERMPDGTKPVLADSIPNKTAAKKIKEKLLVAKHLPPEQTAGTELTLGEWITEWWDGHKSDLADTTARTEGGRVKNHITNRIGHLPLGQVDATAIRIWLEDLKDPVDDQQRPLSPKTRLNIHGYLAMALDQAVIEKKIPLNPCKSTSLPRWEPPEPRFLSDTELGRLIEATPEHWKPLVVFLAATGCRISEALGLKQRRVDVIGGTVTFATQLREQAGKLSDVPLKTKYSRRTIGIPESVCQMLAGMASVDEDAYVFTAPRGGPVHYSVLRRAWLREFDGTEFESLRFHDLRHTHASMLIRRNRPLTAIQRRLGHSSIKVTSDLYGHLDKEVDEGIVGAVEESLGAANVGGIVGAQSARDGVQRRATDLRAEKNPR